MITLEALANKYTFWRYFFELSSIPRQSFNQERACEWVIDYATRWNLSYTRDSYGNIVVNVPANRKELEQLPSICIQAHIDMVCEKNDVAHDFAHDPLQLYITDDQTYVKARDTTLGADDGIGVAYQMAFMDTDCEYPHGPLELLFTLDEEVGLIGATHLERGMIKSEYLINIDNAHEGMCCNGCAGGQDITAEVPVLRESVSPDLVPCELEIKGLSGGHSGSDIFELRANAIKLTERVLSEIKKKIPISVESITSGDKHNAIPRESKVLLFIGEDNIAEMELMLKELQQAVRSELLEVDKNFTIILKKRSNPISESVSESVSESMSGLVFTEPSLSLIIKIMRYSPNGVLMRRNDTSTGTTLSTNLASIHTHDSHVVFSNSARFANEYGKRYVVDMIKDFFDEVDAKCTLNKGYDAWEVSENSSLEKLFCEQYEQWKQKKAVVDVIHGGLECGIIRSTQDQHIDSISIGPQVDFLHSPSERMHIESCNNMWHVIGNMLGAIKELS